MREIEILYEVKDTKEKTLEKLVHFTPKGTRIIHDYYFYHPSKKEMLPSNSQITEWLRVRTQDNHSFLTYKKDIFSTDGEWLYADEHELEIAEPNTLKQILTHLAFEPIVEVHNKRTVFTTEQYEIVLEEVQNLGLYLEVERKNLPDTIEASEVLKDIRKFVAGLGISLGDELYIGKPELLLRKQVKTHSVRCLE